MLPSSSSDFAVSQGITTSDFVAAGNGPKLGGMPSVTTNHFKWLGSLAKTIDPSDTCLCCANFRLPMDAPFA